MSISIINQQEIAYWFRLVPKSVTLNNLERGNNRRRALSLSFLKSVACVCSVWSRVRLMFRMLSHSTACTRLQGRCKFISYGPTEFRTLCLQTRPLARSICHLFTLCPLHQRYVCHAHQPTVLLKQSKQLPRRLVFPSTSVTRHYFRDTQVSYVARRRPCYVA